MKHKLSAIVIICLLVGITWFISLIASAPDSNNARMYFITAGYMILALEIVVLALPRRSKKVNV